MAHINALQQLAARGACNRSNIASSCAKGVPSCLNFICSDACTSTAAGIAQCCGLGTTDETKHCLLSLLRDWEASESSSLAAVITTTPTASADLPCITVAKSLEACAAKTADFLLLPADQKASCLCYSGGSYNPTAFDVQFDSCLAHVETAHPAYWSHKLSEWSIEGTAAKGYWTTSPCAALAAATASVPLTGTQAPANSAASTSSGVTNTIPKSTGSVSAAGGSSATSSAPTSTATGKAAGPPPVSMNALFSAALVVFALVGGTVAIL